MNWDTTCANPVIAGAFSDYKDFVLRIATLYAGSRLIEAADLSGFSDLELKISNDFPDPYTTICTVKDLKDSIDSGEYGQLALEMGVIQLCTAFEILFDRISDHYSISVSKRDAFDVRHWLTAGDAKQIGNRSLMQIRKIHAEKSIISVLDSDEVYLKIAAIIEVRNCFTHTGGIVKNESAKSRISPYAIKTTVGERIILRNNYLDDFLHYMAIHARAFVNRLT
jgi:hypothetical protein